MRRLNANILAWLVMPLLVSVAIPGYGAACKISELRKQYASVTGSIVAATNERNQSRGGDMDLEDQGCISDYGLKGGFGLPSLAGGFLNGLKDAACKAADNFIASNVDQLSASLTSPLGIADVNLGVGKKGEGEGMISLEQRSNELGVDLKSVIDDQFDKLPSVDNGFGEYEYEGKGDITDYEYTTKETISGDRR